MTRRTLTKAAWGVAALLPLGLLAPLAPAAALPTGPSSPPVAAAYAHLDESMDEWASAPALRLPSSYHGGALDNWDNSVTYDNALVIIAYLAHTGGGAASADARQRARTMGDALLRLQSGDPAGDGRVRNAYGPERLFSSSGAPNIQSPGTAMGNNAWAGMALAQLAHATGDVRYRDGARALGSWILTHTRDTRGAGGFTGGINGDGSVVRWKSSEHNIDAIGLFGMLADIDPDPRWGEAQAHARTFLDAMWVPSEGRFAIGSRADGVTVNNDEYIPEDVQSWAYLATRHSGYRAGLDWNTNHLEVTDRTNPAAPITGVGFARQTNPAQLGHNDDTVWLEGTGHMALALRCSGTAAHAATAQRYLSSIEEAQRSGPDADGRGIPANSRVGYAGGDDLNPTSLHTGATAWYLLADARVNPFVLGARC